MIVLVEMAASQGDEEVGELFVSLPLVGRSHEFSEDRTAADGLGVERRSRPAVVEAIVHVPLH